MAIESINNALPAAPTYEWGGLATVEPPRWISHEEYAAFVASPGVRLAELLGVSVDGKVTMGDTVLASDASAPHRTDSYHGILEYRHPEPRPDGAPEDWGKLAVNAYFTHRGLLQRARQLLGKPAVGVVINI